MNHDDFLPECYNVVKREINKTYKDIVYYTIYYKDGSNMQHHKTYEEIMSGKINEQLANALMAYLKVPPYPSKHEQYIAGAIQIDKDIVVRLAKRSLDSNNTAVLQECFKYLDVPQHLSLKEKISLYLLLELEKV